MKKTLAVLIPAIMAQAIGNVLLSMRMKEIGGSDWSVLLPRAVESPTFWFGTALLIVSFLLFIAALSWADLSFVVPAVSMEVVVNVFFARTLLDEAVSLTRWAGVVLISVGVLCILRSGRKGPQLQARRSPGETP